MPIVLLTLLFATAASESRTFAVAPAKSTVRYHIVHKFHGATGTSSTIEGKAVVQPDGRVLAMVRVPMASFDSGERNRDSDMRETVEASRFPFVVFKGVARIDPQALAAGRTATVEMKIEGEVELHGVKKPVEVPLTIEFAPGSARARGTFEVSLDAFEIDRPSLLFVKIDDACRIELDLTLGEAKP